MPQGISVVGGLRIMPDLSEKGIHRLSELIDTTTLQKLADANYSIAGMPISILDAFDGTVLVASGWQDICTRFHRSNPLSGAQCISGNLAIRNQFRSEGIHEYRCTSGLMHIGIPIIVGGRHLANMFLSQFFYEGDVVTREFYMEKARQFGFNTEDYLAALSRVPFLSRSRVTSIISYYKVLAEFISDLADQVLRKIDAEESLRVAHADVIRANVELKEEIVHRKQAEIELGKVDRALRTLSRSNAAIVHAMDERTLADEICRIIVKEKYLMAWIGYPQDEGEQRVLPLAYAGYDEGYLRSIKVTWGDDEWGRGPTGAAIRTGRMCVQNNRLDNPFMSPWREEASRRGFASAIGLPLLNGGKCFGSLTIYASQTDVFIEEECILLKELADNVAFGILSLRMREKNRLAEQELKRSRDRLHDLAAHLQSIREDERTVIAREIHDQLGQMLTALKLNLSRTARGLPGAGTTFGDKLQRDVEMVNDIIQSVKRICTELRPSILDHLGLGAAIEWQAQEFEKRAGIECSVALDRENFDIDPDRSIALFRIFQESLTNVLRHSGATRVKASLADRDEGIVLEISDNGIGIADEQISKADSFGILGMRERVHIWKGVVRITGSRNRGTTVTIIIPKDKKLLR